MADQDKFGLFSFTPSVFSNAPAKEDKFQLNPREKGRQFVTSPSKRGKTADVTFTKFSSLYHGDKYTTADQEQRRYELEKKARQIVPQAFKPSNPSKKPEGAGDYYGTLGKPWPNERTQNPPKQADEITHERRNIVTSPAKAGSYGMVGTNMGYNTYGPQGVCGEFKYYPESDKGKDNGNKRPDTAPQQTKAWRPNSAARKGGYGSGNAGLFSSYKYEPEPYKNPNPFTCRDAKGLKPFRPSHPPRVGAAHGTINSFPKYVGDPDKEKFERERNERRAARERLMGPVFKPPSIPKSMRVQSIQNHKMNIASE